MILNKFGAYHFGALATLYMNNEFCSHPFGDQMITLSRSHTLDLDN